MIAGGVTYTFSDTLIAPGETATFDVDRIRTEQTPDSGGNRIPMKALFGKFHWTPLPNKVPASGLHGRTELKSLQNLRASSFSCGMDCPYEAEWYPYFDSQDPYGNYPIPNQPDARELTMHDYFVDTYGNPSSHAMNTNALYPYGTNDSSILSTQSINNNLTLRMDTGRAGTTQFYYYFTRNDTYISSTDDGNPNACTVEEDGGNESGDATVRVPYATIGNGDGPDTRYNGPTQGCAPGRAGWQRILKRYIVDQNFTTIVDSMNWYEDVDITSPNGLGFTSINTGNASTNDGTYYDTLSYCSPACPSDAATGAVQHQFVQYMGQVFTLQDNQFLYTCSGNYINGH